MNSALLLLYYFEPRNPVQVTVQGELPVAEGVVNASAVKSGTAVSELLAPESVVDLSAVKSGSVDGVEVEVNSEISAQAVSAVTVTGEISAPTSTIHAQSFRQLQGFLPALDADISGQAVSPGVVSGSPVPGLDITGQVTKSGSLEGSPIPDLDISARILKQISVSGELPAPDTAIAGMATISSALTGALPVLDANISGQVTKSGSLEVSPVPGLDITGQVTKSGSLEGSPIPDLDITGQVANPATVQGELPALDSEIVLNSKGRVVGELPIPDPWLFGHVANPATVGAELPAPGAQIRARYPLAGSASGEMLTPEADVQGQRSQPIEIEADLLVPNTDIQGRWVRAATIEADLPVPGAEIRIKLTDLIFGAKLQGSVVRTGDFRSGWFPRPVANLSATAVNQAGVSGEIPAPDFRFMYQLEIFGDFPTPDVEMSGRSGVPLSVSGELPKFQTKIWLKEREHDPEDLLQPPIRRDVTARALTALLNRWDWQLDLSRLLIYDLDNVSSDVLPWLAEKLDMTGVEGWDWVEHDQDRRELLKRAIDLHRMKGTLEGYQTICELAGVRLTGYIAPPAKPYVSKHYSDQEWQDFLSLLPEVRTFRYARTGAADGWFISNHPEDIPTSDPDPEMISETTKPVFGFPSDAVVRVQEQALIHYPDGHEVPLTSAVREYRTQDKLAVDWYSWTEPGDGAGLFVGDAVGDPENSYPVNQKLEARTHNVELSQPYQDSDQSIRRQTTRPSMTPISLEYDSVAEPSTRRGLFVGGSYLEGNLARLQESDSKTPEHYCLARTDAELRVYRRVYLHDPDVPVQRRMGSLYAGAARLGQPAYTLDLRIEMTGTRGADVLSPGGFMGQFVATSDQTRLWKVVDAIHEYSLARDQVYVDFAAWEQLPIGGEIIFGQAKLGEFVESQIYA